MFVPFPDNYAWSTSVNSALSCGGQIGEINDVIVALQPFAATADPDAWDREWNHLANRLAALATADEAAGHRRSAGNKLMRAATYRFIGERQVPIDSPRKIEGFKEFLAEFNHALSLIDSPTQRVEVPFEGSSMPALFVPAQGTGDRPAPTMIFFDGFDVSKEMMWMWVRDEFAVRGIHCLIVDTPGVGEMLRLQGVPSRFDYEAPATATVDYLEGRNDVDPKRIGIMAVSLGGYYAPRAAAFEKRLRCCVAWGAHWDYHAVWERRRNMRPDSPVSVPQFQLAWVMGTPDFESAMEKLKDFRLEGVMGHIECPLLIVHGEQDRQVHLEDAERAYAAAIGTQVKELKVFTPAEGGDQHCQLDNRSLAVDYITDWVADHL